MSWVQDVFIPKYKDKLNGIPERNRGDGFQVIFEALESKKQEFFTIVETGSMRPSGTLEGDGQSTLLFDHFVGYNPGIFISIDVDEKTSEYAKKNTIYTECINSDSVSFLWNELALYVSHDVSLFYLDSYDVDFSNPLAANLHHMKELVTIAKWLKPGTLVAIDDCRFFPGDKRIPQHIDHVYVGKGLFVENFMENIGAKLLFDGYQKVWEIQ